MNEYVYKCNKKTTKKKYWMCLVSGCRVYVQTTSNDLYLGGGTDIHCHALNPELIEVKQVRHQMKERAINEMSSVGMIYDEEIAKTTMSSTALAIFPTNSEICKCSLCNWIKIIFRSIRRPRYRQGPPTSNPVVTTVVPFHYPRHVPIVNRWQTISVARRISTATWTPVAVRKRPSTWFIIWIPYCVHGRDLQQSSTSLFADLHSPRCQLRYMCVTMKAFLRRSISLL